MAVAAEEQPLSVRRIKMDFWDGMEHAFMMPSITTKERTAVWDAVAGYVQEQLLLHKGVRIPTLGSFDAVPQWIQAGNEAVIIQRPVFRLARNLAVVHSLMDDKDYLPGKTFETELVAEPLPRPLLKTSRRVPGGDKQMRREGLPHLGQGTKVGFPGFPFPASPSSRNDEIPPFWEIRGKRRRRSSRVRQRRVIPGGSPGKKQPATSQPKGKPAPTGQAPRQSRAQAAELQSYGGGGGGLVEKILAEIATTQTAKAKPSHAREAATFVTPVIAVLSVTSSEASLREEPAYEVLRQPLPRPRWRKL
ncbi:uncharacterized protein LOC143173383 [Aptenodytes patagonicus]|uniref:uncharacterized protein LOC143173383 n=1 Tax=Aptenodytes patagonicus TaxID=9234 RepID=UPI003F9FA820